MNSAKQFWALFKFLATSSNPAIWTLPAALGIPLYMSLLDKSISKPNQSLDGLLTSPTLFMVGILGLMVLAPEITRLTGMNALAASGTEFLLTRAVNRNILFRSRTALFFLVILAVPLAVFVFSIENPDLQVMGYSKALREQVQRDLPQSRIIPDQEHPNVDGLDQILIPEGRVWVAAWSFWKLSIAAIGVEILVLLVYPLKYRQVVFGTILIAAFIIPLFLPLLLILSLRRQYRDVLSFDETTFFSFTAHLPAMCLLTVAAFILVQLWCERRFTRLEQ